MSLLRRAGLGVLVCLLLCSPAAAGPVALVYSLQGKAMLAIAAERRPLRLFDRLPVGAIVETGPGVRLALAFASGRRYELGAGSRATVGAKNLQAWSGSVRVLPRVPPLPALVPIVEEQAGASAGAVRIRAERIAGLYPGRGAATLAEATTLRFEPVEGAGKYRIEVQDRQGNVVFAIERGDAVVHLPAGALRPGLWYHWTVRTLDRVGPVAQGEADFHVLASALAAKREALRRAVETSGDGALPALLEEVDRSLGLLIETREEADDLLIEAPEGPAAERLETASALLSKAALERARENFAEVEKLARQAREICERIRPESLEMAQALFLLGITAVTRDDRETADFYLKRALAIEERLDTGGAMIATTLESLGLQAFARKDLQTAEDYLRRAIGLNERLEPESLAVAHNLQNLGVIVLRRGHCAAAEDHFQRAFAIRQKLNPGGLDAAKSLRTLAFHNFECGDLPKAAEYYMRALTIYDRLAPGGGAHAMVLHDLGEIYQRQGHRLSAEETLCRAADLVQAKMESSGRAEMYDEQYFTDCLAARVETGRPAEAFHVLERGRARILLEQLTERDLLRSTDLPEEMVHRREQLAQEVESIQGALSRLSSTGDPAEAERLLNALREKRDQQRALLLQIRESSPRFASLRYPESLDLAGARRALDPGTVLLSYAVGKNKSYLFVVQPPDAQDGTGLSVFPLPGESELREAVRSFRNLLQHSASDSSELISRAQRLYALLIEPAEARIAPAQRLLVSADGPLHTLPFAALVRKGRYLVEWKPIHSILSATVYAEIQKARRTAADPAQSQLAAFGSPLYPQLSEKREAAPAVAPEILTAVRSGLSLDPVPASRKEVESIASFYPDARIYLGGEATEERVKLIGSQARLLHFACHGLLNERFPLDSALALSIPEHPAEGQENGLLQAWEIIESVRLDADLVTLSACDTALGQEMSGEGLIGLTRAFQYAGARSVLASLWSVSDTSTAELMRRFYGYLRAGKAKDEALQAAQVELIRSRAFSHPYHWADFQLVGDWK